MGVKVRERPKGSGTWWVFIDHQGKRKAKKIGRDKRLALDVAKKIEAKLVLGDTGLQEKETAAPLFREYAEIWLETYIKGTRRPATYERYSHLLRHYVYPAIGKIPLADIKRSDIRDLMLKLYNGGLSRSTVNTVRHTISGPLAYAVDEEIIPLNVTIGVSKRLGFDREETAEIEPLTPEETSHFLDACKSHYPKHYPFFLCAFRTGMRLGELLGLKWNDVDWYGRFIEVRRSHRRGQTGATKTGNRRRVDMSDQLISTLKELLKRRKEEALRSGRGEVAETIFHGPAGEPMEQNSMRYVFKRVLAKAGLREIRFHDIRHTFASQLLSNGESPVYVKDQLGHTSIQMTVDIYGHLIPSSNREAVNRLDSQQTATYPQPAKTQRA